jgi:hypothetical protein
VARRDAEKCLEVEGYRIHRADIREEVCAEDKMCVLWAG